ncbi:hypothetical protein BGZ47_005371 [Haplosporangium gracile]|nr:hypothetical protein BGZ47_005371 [Haplosporangium gracile]
MILVPFLEGCSDELRTIDDYEGPMDDSNQRRRPSWIHEYPEVRAALKKLIPVKFRELLFDAHEDEWEFQDMDAAIQVYWVMENDDISGREPEICRLIRLDRFRTPFPTTFRNIALAARSGFVQKLCIQDGHMFQSEEILKILRKAIGVIQRIQCWGSLPVLHDYVMDPVPWTCTNLVPLDVQIRSVFRPDIRTNYRGEPLQDYDEAMYHEDFLEAVRLAHRSIYKRLASLESLQILTLGLKTEEDKLESEKVDGRKVYFDPLLQTDCLDLSLEFGLDLLADLRDMRELSVHHLDHRIGVKELKWMERNWLNLEYVAGVIRKDPKKPFGRPFAVEDPNPAECDVGFRLE